MRHHSAFAPSPRPGQPWPSAASGSSRLLVSGLVQWAAVVIYNIAQVSFRQRVCPPELLGRMNASVRFIVWGTQPIGALAGGYLGSEIGIIPTMWISAAGVTLATVPVLFSPLSRMRTLPEGAHAAD